ncbi:MAG: sterol desaturase family protein [Candidatus Binataceae bacterium]
MACDVLIFVAGMLAWSFLEYVIHAWLSHRLDTFARPLHAVHHHDPRAVFTIGAWIPVALAWTCGFALFGWTPGMVCFSGMVAGFTAYEALHYRQHFKRPRNRLERYLRTRHLIHHHRAAHACFGVTSPLWDMIFATEPEKSLMRQWAEAVTRVPELAGPSNLRRLLYLGIPASRAHTTR